MWTSRSKPPAICSRIALTGSSMPGHQHEHLEPVQRVARRVRVDRGQRPVVAGVHRLEHVERLGAADLADDDAVGPHPERVANEVADAHLALALDVRRARLERDDVPLEQPKLGRVLDRDDPLLAGDERGDGVQERRLPGAGTARDQDVELPANALREEVGGLLGERAEPDEVVERERVAGELPDRQRRAASARAAGRSRSRGCRRAGARRPSARTRRRACRPARRCGR